MTIFDAGYSGIEYRPVGMLGRLWCLTWMEFTQLFRTRKGLLVFLACIALLVVKAVVMWGQLSAETDAMARAASMVSPAWSPFRVEFYMSHSTQFGFLPFLVLTTLIGVRAIAGDKETNALEIYWTRGISPWGYFAGKWAGSALLLGAAFFVGPLVLWVYGLLAAPDGTFASTTTPFMPKVLGALLLKSVVVSFLAVAVSAISSSTRVASFLWLLLILGTAALGRILTGVSRVLMRHDPSAADTVPWYKAICPWDAMVRIESDIAGLAPRASDYEQVWIAWACLGGYVVVLLWMLRGELRTTEAVA